MKMNKATSQKLARQMRRNPTDAERKLWSMLRHKQLENYKFRRQHPIGLYIADFACATQRLVIEADGAQHMDNPKDTERTKAMENWGWRVVRFWNSDILSNPDGVLQSILTVLEEQKNGKNPPLPRKGRGIATAALMAFAAPRGVKS